MLIFGDKTRGLIGLATDRLCSAMRNTAARMPWGKIRRQESTDTIGAAMIGMIWTAMACDEHDQQLAGMRLVPRSHYDIKGRPDDHLWMEACDKEINHGSAYSVSAFLPPYLAPRHSGCSVSHG